MPASERALIARIRARARSSRNLVTGLGDDCAVLRVQAGYELLVTTDFSLEGVHFRRNWHSPEVVGHRCLTRGLSDIAAMGGEPLAVFLSLALPGRVALLRVVRVHAHRLGETPVLEELDFDGSEVPTRDALERLGPRLKDPITFMHPLSSDTRLTAFVNQRIDWQHAGFQKVQTVRGRPGDEQAALPSTGISWAELAKRYRRRAAQ